MLEMTGGVISPPPPASSSASESGNPASVRSSGTCVTAPSADTLNVPVPVVVTTMSPEQYPANDVNEPVGAPSSVCRTSVGGAVMQAVACARRTCSTTSMRGRSQPDDCPAPVETMARAGRDLLNQSLFVLLSLPW